MEINVLEVVAAVAENFDCKGSGLSDSPYLICCW